MFQNMSGPSDPLLKRSEVDGYQPVSRIGEVVLNAFVDSYEHAVLPQSVQCKDVDGSIVDPAQATAPFESKPHFHLWASVLPGMICLSRKNRNATFRGYVAAETATPVISCCACLTEVDADGYYFAGICRSKSVRPIDDGAGPILDEFFTLAIGGMSTLLNNSASPVFPGDYIEWCLYASNNGKTIKSAYDLAQGGGTARRTHPRRVSIKVASPASERTIGRCLSFAKPGETFDILIKGC